DDALRGGNEARIEIEQRTGARALQAATLDVEQAAAREHGGVHQRRERTGKLDLAVLRDLEKRRRLRKGLVRELEDRERRGADEVGVEARERVERGEEDPGEVATTLVETRGREGV